MERLTVILCVVLACVAPAMAADYYVQPNQVFGNVGSSDWVTGTYNPTPDATAEATWLTENFTAPFAPANGYSYAPPPYYTFTPGQTGPTASDTIRFQEGWAAATGGYTFSNDKTMLGDTWYPQNFAKYGNLQLNTGVTVTGANWSMNTMQYGRNPDEKPFASQASDGFAPGAWDSFAASSVIQMKNGTLNIGEVRVTNTNTDISMNVTSGSWGITRNLIKTQLGNASFAATTHVNIGDIYLNETPFVLKHQAGTMTITGDIQTMPGAAAGNMVVCIIDPKNEKDSTDPILNIRLTELLQLIDAGQFYVFNGNGNVTSWEGLDDVNIRLDSWSGATKVTRASMYDELDLNWIEGSPGMVSVERYYVGAVPEPATMALLGLGALLLRRKR